MKVRPAQARRQAQVGCMSRDRRTWASPCSAASSQRCQMARILLAMDKKPQPYKYPVGEEHYHPRILTCSPPPSPPYLSPKAPTILPPSQTFLTNSMTATQPENCNDPLKPTDTTSESPPMICGTLLFLLQESQGKAAALEQEQLWLKESRK